MSQVRTYKTTKEALINVAKPQQTNWYKQNKKL